MSFEKMNNGFIVDGLMSVYNNKVKEMLKDLANKYSIKDGTKSISTEELYEKYCINDIVFEETTSVVKKKKEKEKQTVI